MRFWILNVFVRPAADGSVPPSAGNPLAVVECPPGALTSEQMQAIAFEFGFSETTFVAPAAEGGVWPTRIFTPSEELPFAGHPTLGTAHVVRSELAPGDGPVTLRLGAGDVPVEPDDAGRLWLTAPPIAEGVPRDRNVVARAWGLDAAWFDLDFPCVEFSAGPGPTLVPLRHLPRLEHFSAPAAGPGSLYLVARDPAQDALRVRLFAPNHGVPEDPATGSAACCLGRYLLDHGYLGDHRLGAVRVLQGEEMGRPSLLHLRAERTAAGDRIQVGGAVRGFARGELS